jgi:hypothetical protein
LEWCMVMRNIRLSSTCWVKMMMTSDTEKVVPVVVTTFGCIAIHSHSIFGWFF